jgi:ribosomal protein S17E
MLKSNQHKTYKYSKGEELMCKFIGMEYLAASALINIYKKKKIKEVSFKMLNEYGISIMKEFIEKKISVIILFSNIYASNLVRDYSECFDLEFKKEDYYLILKDEIQTDDLLNRFLGYLSVDILKTLFNEKVLASLGI